MTDYQTWRDSQPARVSSLIHFAPEVPKERIEAWIAKLMKEGFVTSHTTREWKGDGPCWYVP